MTRDESSWRAVATSGVLLATIVAVAALVLLGAVGVPLSSWRELVALPFTSYVVRTVTSGAIVLGVVGGVLGSFAVLRGQSLVGDAASHSALPGIYLFFMFWSVLGLGEITVAGMDLPAARSLPVVLLGALVTSVLATGLVLVVSRFTRLREDAALGVSLATFFGFGIVLRSFLQSHPEAFGDRAGLESFLFGTAATMTRSDVRLMALLTLVALACLIALWKELKLLSFDRDYGVTIGLPMTMLDVLLTALIVVAVIVGLQTVGVVLMSALLIAPAVAARQWTNELWVMVALAAILGATSGVVGVFASSMREGLSTGPLIALFAAALALASVALAPNRGLAWRALSRRRRARQFELDTVVIHVRERATPGVPADEAVLARELGWSRPRLHGVMGRALTAGLVSKTAGGLAITEAGVRHADLVLSRLGARRMDAP